MDVEFPTSSVVGALERSLIRRGEWRKLQIPVRYGFFHHPWVGPTLIDTGYTDRVTTGERSLELRLYSAGLRPQLVEAGQLRPFLAARNLSPEDVRAVILTHFHADHISAARDLTNAQFYACGLAYEHLLRWSQVKRIWHGVFLDLLPDDFSDRMTPFEQASKVDGPLGLGGCWDLFGDATTLIVPLPGHAIGHVGVAFPAQEPPLLYAADTEWLRGALTPERSGLAARLVSHDRSAAKLSNALVHEFERRGGRLVLCHDPDPVP